MKQIHRTIIQEGLDEHYYETVTSVEEEKQIMRNFDKALEEFYEERFEVQKDIVGNYKTQNPNPICERCLVKRCLLLDTTFGCGYIGKKLEDTFSPKNPYKIVDIPKGIWDEIFHPLTDEQINRILFII